MAIILRHAIADYLNIGTKMNPIWALCGTGFNNLDESPNAQVESRTYVHENDAYPSIIRYESSFDFETDMWNDQEAVNLIYNIGRNRCVGENAMVQYLRTDFLIDKDGSIINNIVTARMFNCACEVSDIQGGGGEIITVSGVFHVCGHHTEGMFDLGYRLFMPDETMASILSNLDIDVGTGKLMAEDSAYTFSVNDSNGHLMIEYS